eukprot:1528054-Rhodomonas_salina.1
MANRAYAFAVVVRDLPIRMVAHVLTLFLQCVNLPEQLLDGLCCLLQGRGEVALRRRCSGERSVQEAHGGRIVFQLSQRRRWPVWLLRLSSACFLRFAKANPGTGNKDPESTAPT